MLGIADVRVLEARDVDGEVELTVETTADRDWCRMCGVRAHSKGRATILVRDVDGCGRRARLVWRKRRWRCPESACPAGSWTQQHPAVLPRLSMTERARAHACRRVGAERFTLLSSVSPQGEAILGLSTEPYIIRNDRGISFANIAGSDPFHVVRP
jgi:hypothetical protein